VRRLIAVAVLIVAVLMVAGYFGTRGSTKHASAIDVSTGSDDPALGTSDEGVAVEDIPNLNTVGGLGSYYFHSDFSQTEYALMIREVEKCHADFACIRRVAVAAVQLTGARSGTHTP
jgi:hypothetical protein